MALVCTAVLPSSAQRVCESGPRTGISCSSWAVSWKELVFLQPLAMQYYDPVRQGFREGSE